MQHTQSKSTAIFPLYSDYVKYPKRALQARMPKSQLWNKLSGGAKNANYLFLEEKGEEIWRKNGGRKVSYIRFTLEALWIVMGMELGISREFFQN